MGTGGVSLEPIDPIVPPGWVTDLDSGVGRCRRLAFGGEKAISGASDPIVEVPSPSTRRRDFRRREERAGRVGVPDRRGVGIEVQGLTLVARRDGRALLLPPDPIFRSVVVSEAGPRLANPFGGSPRSTG